MSTPDHKSDDEVEEIDETDLDLLSAYTRVPFSRDIQAVDKSIDELKQHIESIKGGRENFYGLHAPGTWNMDDVKKVGQIPSEFVGHCTKILSDEQRQLYIVAWHHQKLVVELHQQVAPGDVTEGCRVALEHKDFKIAHVLNHSIDPLVAAMQLQERPDVTYQDVGGCKEQLEKLKEVKIGRAHV
jgi:26S proteasome regulatory subunit T1